MFSPSSEEYFEILRYIKGSLGKGILYGHHEHLNISAYCDAGWADSPDDHQSMPGYFSSVR